MPTIKEIIKTYKIKESQLKKMWHQEIQRRVDFGISDEIFWQTQNCVVRYCSIKFSRDFDSLYNSYLVRKGIRFNPTTNFRDYEQRRLAIDSVNKYKTYTFSQIKDAGGALQLSLVCPFVHIIVDKEIEYKGCKIEVFYRTKNAAQSSEFPLKVLEVFKNDSRCKAVAYVYRKPTIKFVMFEKTKKNPYVDCDIYG
jgi:hypothetical protein